MHDGSTFFEFLQVESRTGVVGALPQEQYQLILELIRSDAHSSISEREKARLRGFLSRSDLVLERDEHGRVRLQTCLHFCKRMLCCCHALMLF